MRSFVPFALAGLLGIVGSAQAATITFSANKPLAASNWTDVLALGKFNTALGTLNSITFDFSGITQSVGRVESFSSSSTDVDLSFGASFALTRPDASSLLNITNPGYTGTFSLAAFDGSLDFAGNSGGSTGLQVLSASGSRLSTSANDFALFSAAGGGTINLGISVLAVSSNTGTGNLAAYVQTSAGSDASVTYNYTAAPVPEPETYAMMLAGLGLLAFAKRRKTAKSLAH